MTALQTRGKRRSPFFATFAIHRRRFRYVACKCLLFSALHRPVAISLAGSGTGLPVPFAVETAPLRAGAAMLQAEGGSSYPGETGSQSLLLRDMEQASRYQLFHGQVQQMSSLQEWIA